IHKICHRIGPLSKVMDIRKIVKFEPSQSNFWRAYRAVAVCEPEIAKAQAKIGDFLCSWLLKEV
ncbi:MAG: hypothetical protein NTW04_02755, partial [Elusimicrobia bacterium]|nr:hypothetical protein [Elusimicrobiota bacterium]